MTAGGFAGRYRRSFAARVALVLCLWSTPLLAEPQHGIAMHGEPALPPDFVALPYANPDAPKGGRIVFGEAGGFDSMNPYIVKGRAPAGVAAHTVETLMGRSQDEPFSLYGLLAESVETDAARSWVEFALRPEARFSDGTPVTVEDVIWSYETLGTLGHPRYQTAWSKVASIEKTGERKVKITFTAPDRELALLMGMRPVLKKAQWDGKAFDDSTMEVPIGSGAYVVDGFEPGRFVDFRRNPDWWGKDLPFNRGQNNFDEIRYDYFGDAGIVFEAFKAGEIDLWRETNAGKWARDYNFPAVVSGDIVKSEIANARPSGMSGFVMNMRRPQFRDWRVREALITAFNFDFINATINDGAEPRITSYFANSGLSGGNGPATPEVAALLQPYAAELLPGAVEGYAPPPGNAAAMDRGAMRKATALLEDAGWTVQDGVLKDAAGAPFPLEILLAQGATETGTIADIYSESLKKIGIVPVISSVDSAQYKERTNAYDFDMTWYARPMSLSPGNEMILYFGAQGLTEPGTRNWMGLASPAVDGLIATMLAATEPADFVTATQALDRVLTAGRYVVPAWYERTSRVAHTKHLHYPAKVPLYGYWPGFIPEVWWYEE